VWNISDSFKTEAVLQKVYTLLPPHLSHGHPQARRIRRFAGLPFSRSVRFIVFDKYANIVAQNQLEFPQYYPHPGLVILPVVF